MNLPSHENHKNLKINLDKYTIYHIYVDGMGYRDTPPEV